MRELSWNSERPLIFIAVVLERAQGVVRARDIRKRLEHRMDFWEQGHHTALIDDTVSLLKERAQKYAPTKNPEKEARTFNLMVLSGRLRSAVRRLTFREGGGILQPEDNCTKTGRPVLDVLCKKHPELREPSNIGSATGSFEPVPDADWMKPIPVNVTTDTVAQVATHLSGAAGPDGVDGIDLRNWLLRFGNESEIMRAEMSLWCMWLANSHPPWAAYRAMMAGRLVPFGKEPGVQPIGIGSIIRRTLAKCLIKAVGSQATAACGNHNLCAGLPAGIEVAVHAVEGKMRPDNREPNPESESAPAPPPNPRRDGIGLCQP